MQAVHDQDDGALDLVVQSAVEGVIEHSFAPGLGSLTTPLRASARVIGSELDLPTVDPIMRQTNLLADPDGSRIQPKSYLRVDVIVFPRG